MLFQIARGTQWSDLPQKCLRASRPNIIFLVSWPDSNILDWQTRDTPLSLGRIYAIMTAIGFRVLLSSTSQIPWQNLS